MVKKVIIDDYIFKINEEGIIVKCNPSWYGYHWGEDISER